MKELVDHIAKQEGLAIDEAAKKDFIDAFHNLIDIEKECFNGYCDKIE